MDVKDFHVTPMQVFAATLVAVVAAIALVVAGVVVLAGLGWALITAGSLYGCAAVVACWALLREPAGGVQS